MTDTSSTQPFAHPFDLIEAKIRDGRYGPVFIGLTSDTGNLITAEQLDPEETSDSYVLESVMLHLKKKQMNQVEPNVVSYLGYQCKAERIFILTEYLPGGTLREFIQKFGAISQVLARSFIRQIVAGLEQLQRQGFAVVFLDSRKIFLKNTGCIKIEPPILDVTITGEQLPPAILTLPELILGQRNIRKADVWLLGIIAAQILSGDCNIGAASYIVTQIKQNQELELELLLPQGVASKLDKEASDFLRQCLSINIDQRPSISDLKEHPFLSRTE